MIDFFRDLPTVLFGICFGTSGIAIACSLEVCNFLPCCWDFLQVTHIGLTHRRASVPSEVVLMVADALCLDVVEGERLYTCLLHLGLQP